MAQLTCQKLCVGYDGKSVLQDLDFEVFAGDYIRYCPASVPDHADQRMQHFMSC